MLVLTQCTWSSNWPSHRNEFDFAGIAIARRKFKVSLTWFLRMLKSAYLLAITTFAFPWAFLSTINKNQYRYCPKRWLLWCLLWLWSLLHTIRRYITWFHCHVGSFLRGFPAVTSFEQLSLQETKWIRPTCAYYYPLGLESAEGSCWQPLHRTVD